MPNTAAEHYYLITDTIDGLGPDTPIFEDPAAHGYYREEGGGMMVGLFEPRAAAWHPEGMPAGVVVHRRSSPTGTGWARSWRPRWRGCR